MSSGIFRELLGQRRLERKAGMFFFQASLQIQGCFYNGVPERVYAKIGYRGGVHLSSRKGIEREHGFTLSRLMSPDACIGG
jgi:hypothetical protein